MENPTGKATKLFLVVLLIALLLLGFFISSPFIEPLAMAVIIAVAFQPLHRWILGRIRKPGRSALLTVLAIILLVAVPLTLIMIAASGQAIGAAHFVRSKSAEQGGFVSMVMAILEKPLAFIGRYADLSGYDIQAQVNSRLQQASVKLLALSAGILGNVVGLLGQLLLALFAAFFFFRDGDKIVKRILNVMPLSHDRGRRLLTSIENAIIANFYAIVAVGGAQGALTTIGLLIVGNRSAILLGLLASFCSLIPLIGPALIWGPVAAYLFFIGRTGAGLFLVLWGILAVGSVDNVLRPIVVGGKLQAHPLLLFLALFGGAQAFGLLGLFLGPVLLSLITAVVSTLNEIRTAESEHVISEAITAP